MEDKMRIAERIIRTLLDKAEIAVDGNKPWDIKVNDRRFYSRVMVQGSLGLGESYMDGWWDCPHLDQFSDRIQKSGTPWVEIINPFSLGLFLKSKLVNLAPKRKAFIIGERHYDLGNSLFQAMLDKTTMSYSCGYLRNASNLDDAQVAKLDLICRKPRLQPGQRILDIGCGWGGFPYYAATHCGVEVVGLTVSKEQAVLAKERCKGLPVEIRLQDYRDINEQFDHIVSVGMFEHVESKNYRVYMEVVRKCLKPGGLFLLHTIGKRHEPFHSGNPWTRKYIFPLGEVPTSRQITDSSRGLLYIRDWHEFGEYYDPTLMFWYSNFISAWDELKAEYGHQVGGKFRRMWEYYLLTFAGSFRARSLELWQVVLAHVGEQGNYCPVR